MNKPILVMIVFLLGSSLAGSAFAQVPARSVRLDLGIDAVRLQVGGWNPAGPEDWRHTRLELGIGNPNVMMGLGVTVVDALTIGLRFSIAMDNSKMSFDEDDSELEEEEVTTDFDAMKFSHFSWGVMPYLEYAFLTKVVRPFLMITLGFDQEKDDIAYTTTTYWDFILGGGGGIHFFASPSVSIDLGLLLGFTAGGGGIESELETEPPAEGEEEDDGEDRFVRILFRLNCSLGVSGWF